MPDDIKPVLTDQQILAVGAFGQAPLRRLNHGRAVENEVLRVLADREGRQTAGSLQEPVNGEGWKVHWWNESMRLLLPDHLRIDGHQHYRNGTIQLTIKAAALLAKGE